MDYAEVAVNAPVNNTFHYHIPDRLRGRVQVGHLVRVGFGTAMQPAIVLAIHDALPPKLRDIKTKPIIELLDPKPVMSAEHIALAAWLSESYLTPLGACLWLMLPPGLTGRSTRQIHLLDDSAQVTNASQQAVLDALQEQDPITENALAKITEIKGLRRVLKALEEASIIEQEAILTPPTVTRKTVRTVIRDIPPDEIIAALSRLKRAPKQSQIFNYIARFDYPLDVPEVYEATGANSTDLNNLALRGLVRMGERIVYRDSLADRDFVAATPPDLTDDQAQVWEIVRAALTPHQPAAAQTAYETRQPPTRAENVLWSHLRGRTLGVRFRRQQRIGAHIVSFAAAGAALAVDLIASDHPRPATEQEQRAQAINAAGYHLLTMDDRHVLADVASVIAQIEAALSARTDQPAPPRSAFLLHGVTGSGKTEIYLRAIAETIAQGRQALFLVPEIALTPQTIRRVAERFPDQVAVVHGSLSAGERYDTWRRARRGEIGVIVGTRSALFTPLPDVGVIILDEEHDASYKHSPPFNPPYYHARAAAEELADLNGAALILGSATPDLTTRYRAERGHLRYLSLPQRIMGHRQRVTAQAKQRGVTLAYQADSGEAMSIGLPPVTVIDMRDELRAGNTTMFSGELQAALHTVIERGEQAMLFLNRRGQATYVFCRDCGYVAQCKRCDTPLTYHRHGEALRCHHCGYTQKPPLRCPDCTGERIRYFGAGTQQVEQALYTLLPDVRALRWDRDTASKPDQHEAILGQFAAGEADILIGTQMIAKGLDLPLVTLVGVISADPGLALPDFRAGERAFQILAQVAGRAGRGVLGGRVIVQTYQPQHRSIVHAAEHDYAAFYADELDARRDLGYPPFRRMGRVLIQHTHPIEAERQAQSAAKQIIAHIAAHDLDEARLIGPAPCFFARIDRHYRWQVLVRSADPAAVLRGLQTQAGWYIDIDPVDIL